MQPRLSDFAAAREDKKTVGQYLLHGEPQRLILLRHEGVAVDDVKDFRRGGACVGACGFVLVHWENSFSFCSAALRFDDDLIGYLLELKWWDWSAEKIFCNLETLCSANLSDIKNIK